MQQALIRGFAALASACAFHAALVAGAACFGWFSPGDVTLPELDLTSVDLSFSETPDEAAAPMLPPPSPAIEKPIPPPPSVAEPPPPPLRHPLSHRHTWQSRHPKQNHRRSSNHNPPSRFRPRPHRPRHASPWTSRPPPADTSSPTTRKARASAVRKAMSSLSWTFRRQARWTTFASSPPADSRNSSRPPSRPQSARASRRPGAVPKTSPQPPA